MDGDERRRRSLEAGREMLEKYKTERARKFLHTDMGQGADLSDAESVLNEVSMERRDSCTQEGLSSRDMTQNSISMSEGEGDGDLVMMAGRVARLEEELQGKEVIVEALSAELDQLKGEPSSPNSSQSQTSSTQGINVVSLYQYKLQEFEEAVKSRDCLIEQLSNSLKTALETRDELVARLKVLNATQISSKDSTALEEENMNLQEKVTALEVSLKDKETAIHQLNAQLDTRNAEIDDCKLQINALNEQIRVAVQKDLDIAETLEQQKQYEYRVEKIKQEMQNIVKKFSDEMEAKNNYHKKELKDLAEKHDLEITNMQVQYEERLKLMQENSKTLQDRINKELPDLEIKHAKELSAFQLQLASYKTTVETLKKELMNRAESQKTAQVELNMYKGKLEELSIQAERTRRLQEFNFQKEKEMLIGQIDLHKTQLEDVTSKYLSMSAVLESKESIERTLEQTLLNVDSLKQDNDVLRFKLDDLSSRYSAAQSLIENSQQHERSLSNRIFDLEKSLSRLSGINISNVSELNETTYQTFSEIAVQYEMTRQTLEEKEKMEKLLTEKVNRLQEEVQKSTKELEEANLTKKSYEKQLKDMKNMCDKLKSENDTLTSRTTDHNESGKSESSDDAKNMQSECLSELRLKITAYEQQIAELNGQLERKDLENSGLREKMRKSEDECDYLKNGLAMAYAQCAEVQEKLNQTLAMNDTKVDLSQTSGSFDVSLLKQFQAQERADNSIAVNSCDGREDQSLSVKDNSMEVENTARLHREFVTLKNENEDLRRELKNALESQAARNEEIANKLQDYKKLCERLENEKLVIMEENLTLKKKQEVINSLRQCVHQLKKERDSLHAEMKNLIDGHREEVDAIRTDSAAKIQKVQLLLDEKSSNKVLEGMRAELEASHAREMSELRRYFEQRCQQIEKQYSEEMYSQQSKKMSDNDSEIEELTDDLYIGGVGDCLEISNVPERSAAETTELRDETREKNRQNDKADGASSPGKSEILMQILQAKESEIQEIKSSYDKILQDLEERHMQELQEVKERHGRTILLKAVNQHCQTESDVNSLETGAYSHQLEEQVAQAKVDILNALQERIQALLAGEDDWPTELLQIRDKFTSNAKREMEMLKDDHAREIRRLKEEHSKKLAITVDQHQQELERVKARTTFANSAKESEILKERDILSKTCATLKDLVNELTKYFATCEEELNNTLISEVLRRQLTDNNDSNKNEPVDGTQSVEGGKKTADDSVMNTSEVKIKRVHFAPQISEIVSVLSSDKDDLQNMIGTNEDVTEQLRKELKNCLVRLKLESAQILGTSCSESQLIDNSELEWSETVTEDLRIRLSHAENLILRYQEESEALKEQILMLQRKLANAENKKEVISEGYGEHDESGGGGDVALQDFSQLQEKARHVLSNGGGDCSYLLQIIEEFCTQNERLLDETKKEKEDLQQEVPLEPTPPPYIDRVCCRKIEAADKQLKATRKFLEEQASEREAERDESARHIKRLEEQLKEREREKERDLRISSEATLSPEPPSDTRLLRAAEVGAAVEALESQMREMIVQISDMEEQKAEAESDLKVAVDKIETLRDIIAHLEQQIQAKIVKEGAMQLEISQLNAVINAQTRNQQELVQELDAIKMGSENCKLNEHINDLQEELRKYKLSTEHFTVNSSALKQMKLELREMQNQLDKRTKELESLHMCGSNLSLSQPSEDVSIRDQIDASRCPTPDDPSAPPTLPLDQVLKVKEKMSKHARAEEVVFKRIKDLEMQLNALKNQNEELQAEQEILQQTASEQLFQIEAMRGRLEQQKQSAPFAQRQATSRLELQLHEANAKFQSLEQIIAEKDLELKDLKGQLERTNQMLLEKEAEIANVVQFESNTIQKLKERLQLVEEEKRILESKVGQQEQTQLELPKLLDSMLADKNEEIDHLKEQLSKKEKQLEMFSSVALDDEGQFKEFAKQVQTEAKNSARTLSDILSIHSECEEVSEAIRALPTSSRIMSHNASTLRIPVSSTAIGEIDATGLLEANKECIEVPPLDFGSQSPTLSISGQRISRVSLGMDVMSPPVDTVNDGLNAAKSRESSTNDASSKSSCPKHGSKSNDTEATTDNLTKLRIQQLENQLTEIKADLDSKSATLELREGELLTLQKNLEELQVDFKETVDTLTRDKYFYKNQYELSQVSESKIKKDLEEVENALKLKIDELQDYRSKMQTNEKIIMELNSENTRLRRNAENNDEEFAKRYENLLEERREEIKSLKDSIFEKDVTIETIQTRNIEIENENKQLYEFKTKFEQCKQELVACRNELQRLTEGLNNRDQIIRRLEEMARRTSLSGASSPSDEKDQEIHHLQEYIKEKDKVIRQMSDDSKSLHKALETIQNKMKESGNVVELRRKLKDERRINSELRSMVEKLRKKLEESRERLANRSQDDTDIEDMVQRELNLSATLDRQILNAIESEPEEELTNGLSFQSRTSQEQQENVAQKYLDVKLKLKQSNKINEELNKLKDDLEIERDMLKSQIAEYEERILQIKADFDDECRKVAKLDDELSFERSVVRNLKIQLDKEQKNVQLGTVRQAEVVEFLQEKLRSSMENEERLRNEMSILRQDHQNLEKQLCAIREEMQSQKKSDKSSQITDLLVAEQKKYVELAEEYEKERKFNDEMKATLKKVESERNRYEKQLDVVEEEKEKFVSSLALAEGIKEHLEIDLRRTREELKTREKECQWLEKRIETMMTAESERQKQVSSDHSELKILRREVNNAREVMMDLEADMQQSRRELSEAIQRELKLSESLEKLKDRESELNKKLAVAREEEKRLKDIIAELQHELKIATKRENDLARESSNERTTSPRLAQKIKELNEMNERYVHEKNSLYEKLMKFREERERLSMRVKNLESQLMSQNKSMQAANPLNKEMCEKLQHFYGKYLRVDSRRKALAYQKRYLLCIVGGYQISEENTLSVLARLTQTQRSYTSRGRNKNPRVRFRIAVLLVVSITRMKWLVHRWRVGKRVGANTLLDDLNRSFIPIHRPAPNHSPPVRERVVSNGEEALGGFALGQYYQRLQNIQQNLGLALGEPSTACIHPD